MEIGTQLTRSLTRIQTSIGSRFLHSTPCLGHLVKLTRCRVVDNSAIGKLAMAEGKPPKVIHIYNKKGIGTIGDKVLVAIKGEKKKAIVVGVKMYQPYFLPRTDTNNIVLIEENGTPLGTRIHVPIPIVLRKILKEKTLSKGPDYTKLLAIATSYEFELPYSGFRYKKKLDFGKLSLEGDEFNEIPKISPSQDSSVGFIEVLRGFPLRYHLPKVIFFSFPSRGFCKLVQLLLTRSFLRKLASILTQKCDLKVLCSDARIMDRFTGQIPGVKAMEPGHSNQLGSSLDETEEPVILEQGRFDKRARAGLSDSQSWRRCLLSMYIRCFKEE